MNKIKDILEAYSSKSLIDEDGNKLSIETMPPISIEKLREFEKIYRVSLPEEILELLLFSNGIKIFGVKIYSLEEMDFFEDQMLLAFHGWGNGDFDCLSVEQGAQSGIVFFSNHSINNSLSMNISFSEWISMSIKEIEHKRALLHPMDYLFRNEEGVYKGVYLKLKLK
jgi:SMI1 / KNR4 family (SUKH-1)